MDEPNKAHPFFFIYPLLKNIENFFVLIDIYLENMYVYEEIDKTYRE